MVYLVIGLIFSVLLPLQIRADAPVCPPQNLGLLAPIPLCQYTKKILGCDTYHKNDPEIQKNIRNCSREEFIDEYVNSDFKRIAGCFQGANKFSGDIRQLIQLAWDRWKQREAYFTDIERDVNKKRDLIKDHPGFNALSDEQLNSYDAVYLYDVAGVYKSLESHEDLHDWEKAHPAPRDEEPDKTYVTDPETEKKMRDLNQWAIDGLQGAGVKLGCFKEQAKWELICYYASSYVFGKGVGKMKGMLGKLLQAEVKGATKIAPAATAVEARTDTALRDWINKYTAPDKVFSSEHDRYLFKLEADRALNGAGDARFRTANMNFIKTVSDKANSPAVADAMRNRFFEIQAAKRIALEEKYKIRGTDYTSFKSGAMTSQQIENFNAFSAELQEQTINEFMKDANIIYLAEKYGVPLDRLATSGRGATYQTADLAARKQRQMDNPTVEADWSDPKIQAAFKSDLKEIEKARVKLVKFRDSDLMTKIPDRHFGGYVTIPSLRTIEIVRKNKGSVEKIRKAIRDQKLWNKDLSDADIQNLQTYTDRLDQFAINTLKVNQSTLRVMNSTNGVAAVDFPGVGALEKRVYAEEVYNAHMNLNDAVDASIGAEKKVTDALDGMRNYVKTKANSIADGTTTRMNGDDGLSEFVTPLTNDRKLKYLKEISHEAYLGPPRVSFTQPGIADAAVAETLYKQGHNIEKLFRADLVGKIPNEKLDKIIFAIDMQTKTAGKGQVGLYVQKMKESADILDYEKKIIKESFSKALETFNSTNANTNYMPSTFTGL